MDKIINNSDLLRLNSIVDRLMRNDYLEDDKTVRNVRELVAIARDIYSQIDVVKSQKLTDLLKEL